MMAQLIWNIVIFVKIKEKDYLWKKTASKQTVFKVKRNVKKTETFDFWQENNEFVRRWHTDYFYLSPILDKNCTERTFPYKLWKYLGNDSLLDSKGCKLQSEELQGTSVIPRGVHKRVQESTLLLVIFWTLNWQVIDVCSCSQHPTVKKTWRQTNGLQSNRRQRMINWHIYPK